MRSWLKGGLWGAFIGLIYFVALLTTSLLSSSATESGGLSAKLGILFLILATPFYLFMYSPKGSSAVFLFTKLFFIIVLTFFILGCIVGLIIGKIKSKHKSQNPQVIS